MREIKGLSPENDDYLDEKEESFISVIQNEPLKDEQSLALPVNNGETSSDEKQTKKLNKQVSWSEAQDINAKRESPDSGDESLQEDENSEKLNSEMKSCNCDSGVALNGQCTLKENDSKTDQMEGEDKEKEKDVEPGKFDEVFSDTDDSEASDER